MLTNPQRFKPNYSAGINKGNSFTSDGFYMMYVQQWMKSTGSVGVRVTINGMTYSYDSGGNWGSWVCPYIIKKGDVVSLSTDGTGILAYCFPMEAF